MADAKKEQAYRWGEKAETIVAEWLITKGYTIRERRWRPSANHSEIDIIAQKDDTLIFVEVKARTDMDSDPTDAISPEKMKKIVRGANSYMQMQEYEFSYRFDVAAVNGNPDSYELDYLEDAFLPPLMSR